MGSIWIVNMLNVDVHLNIGKKLVQKINYKRNKKNWNTSVSSFVSLSAFAPCLDSFLTFLQF